MNREQKKALKELKSAMSILIIALIASVPATIGMIKYCVWMWSLIM